MECRAVTKQHKMPEGFLWIRQSFIDRALLPLSPPNELNIINLKRALAYIKLKWSSQTLTFENWLRVAYKISISEDLAWVYYTAYLAVEYEPFSQYQNDFKRISLASKPNLQPIPILPFIVLLFCQEISKINLRSSHNTADLWPSQESSETHSEEDCEKKLSKYFLTGALKDLLGILSVYDQNVTDYKNPISNANQIKLSTVSAALSILFDSSGTKEARVIWSLDDFLRKNQLSLAAGTYEDNDIWLRSQDLIRLIFSCLIKDPFKPSLNCGITGNSTSKTISNHKSAPPSHRLVVLINHKSKTVAKDGDVFEGSTVKIHRCRDSNIYILRALKDVVIQDCRNCQVILGPVANTVKLYRCHDVVVIGVCWRLLAIDSKQTRFAVKSSSSPVLLGPKNSDLLFGPYNTCYNWLGEDLLKAKLDFRLANDDWAKPISLTSDCGKVVEHKCWTTLSPEKFEIFVIPFKRSEQLDKEENTTEKEAREAAVSIPEDFVTAIRLKREKFAEWQGKTGQMDEVALAKLLSEVQTTFQSFFRQDQFQEIKQLDQMITRINAANKD